MERNLKYFRVLNPLLSVADMNNAFIVSILSPIIKQLYHDLENLYQFKSQEEFRQTKDFEDGYKLAIKNIIYRLEGSIYE